MGAWGTAIFSDDLAADARDEFTDLIAEGLSPLEATDRLRASELYDEADAEVFWLALAATQWKLGRLLEDVRDRALQIIDSGADLERWRDNPKSEINQRKKHLARLREQLLSPQPPAKQLRVRKKASTDLRPGDIASYRLDDVVAVRFCVLELLTDRGGTYAGICLLSLDDGDAFSKDAVTLEDTLGPHFLMVSHEPADRVTLLRRDVPVPEPNIEAARLWNDVTRVPVRGCVCSWKNFPEFLRKALRELRWIE